MSPAFERLPASIAEALIARGFTALTPIQERVLDPALAGVDLRITSQTGSGKTLALGFLLAPALIQLANTPQAGPFALIIAPTRELAAQLGKELGWLYAKLNIGVAVVAGGASYRVELRALSKNPMIIVGTPGRLKDHLERGAIETAFIARVILDEADQMLDLGFREELEAILGMLPVERQTHLMSATFPRDVLALANRYQKKAVLVEGTGLGDANSDITHVAHLVHLNERESALINLLLMAPSERTLMFVRTRADATDLATRLTRAGFYALPLSGDLAQAERNKTLEAFRAGAVSTLVATDVAARGLDIPNVGRVIHVDPPNDRENLTHRSGRTGRAGKKGTSILLSPPGARSRMLEMFRNAHVELTWLPIPRAEEIFRAADDRLSSSLSAGVTAPIVPRLDALADRLLAELEPKMLVRLLLERAGHGGPTAPRSVTPLEIYGDRSSGRSASGRSASGRSASGHSASARPPHKAKSRAQEHYVSFRINFGDADGADKRRLLAMICHRGKVKGADVGAIRIEEHESTFDVAIDSAEKFSHAARKADHRNPELEISRVGAPSIAARAPTTPTGKKRAPKHVRKARAKANNHSAEAHA